MKNLADGLSDKSITIIEVQKDNSWHPYRDLVFLVSYVQFWIGLFVGIVLMNLISMVL